jgi:hypothetical protein
MPNLRIDEAIRALPLSLQHVVLSLAQGKFRYYKLVTLEICAVFFLI